MSPASRRRRRKTTVRKASTLSDKTAMEVHLPGRSGGPSLWGACLSDCTCSLGRMVVGVATERLQS